MLRVDEDQVLPARRRCIMPDAHDESRWDHRGVGGGAGRIPCVELRAGTSEEREVQRLRISRTGGGGDRGVEPLLRLGKYLRGSELRPEVDCHRARSFTQENQAEARVGGGHADELRPRRHLCVRQSLKERYGGVVRRARRRQGSVDACNLLSVAIGRAVCMARGYRAAIEVEVRRVRDRVRELVDEEPTSNDVVIVGAFEIALRTVDDQLRIGGHEHEACAECARIGLLQACDVPARSCGQQDRKRGQHCMEKERMPGARRGRLILRDALP